MKKLLPLFLAGACGSAIAQTPAVNPMPDGSRDMYIGLGLVSAPAYQGATKRDVKAQPLLQVEWSNGLFISGMSAGMHLSREPAMEFGPLLAIQPRRGASGSAGVASCPSCAIPAGSDSALTGTVAPVLRDRMLAGIEPIGARLQAGGFFNYYLAPNVRMTSSLLYGSGRDRNGLVVSFGLQQIATEISPLHRLSVSTGITFVNRGHNESFFGVSESEFARSGYRPHAPLGGVRDIHVAARWNWLLTPSWMLTSSARAARLHEDARKSPLVRRPTDVSVSTGLVYRF